MNRRDSLKTMTLSMTAIIAGPSLLQLLSACEPEREQLWKAHFLNSHQVFIVGQLADLILPQSESIGALDLVIPQFIDLVLKNVLDLEAQEKFRKGGLIFEEKFKSTFKKEASRGSKKEFDTLLKQYFELSETQQASIFKLVNSDISVVHNRDKYYLYSYLICIRHYTLLGFYSSKEVGTTIFNYQPVPGVFTPCIPLKSVGNNYAV